MSFVTMHRLLLCADSVQLNQFLVAKLLHDLRKSSGDMETWSEGLDSDWHCPIPQAFPNLTKLTSTKKSLEADLGMLNLPLIFGVVGEASC